MSEVNTSPTGRFVSRTAKIVVGGVVLLFLLCSGLIIPIVQIGWYLATGWFTFLGRTSREMHVSIASLSWFAVSLALLTFLTHRTAVWMVSHRAHATSPDAVPPPTRVWPLRRSSALLLAVLSSFIAGVCLVGITHETIWMATSNDPRLDMGGGFARSSHRNRSRINLEQLGLALHENHDAFQGFPASATFDELGQIRHGWVTPLLPFLDAKPLYNQVRFDQPWYAAEDRKSVV